MSFAQVNESSPDSFATQEYFKSISPLNKTSKFIYNVDTTRVFVIEGTPNVGDALIYSSSAAGTWPDPDKVTWGSNGVGTIVAGVPGAATGGSKLTITTPAPGVVGLAVANTSIVPGTYGAANAVPVITFDAQGQATSVYNDPIIFPNQLLSIPLRNWKAGTNSIVGVNDCVAVGDSSEALIESVAVGSDAKTRGTQSVSIGNQSRAELLGVSVGWQAGSLAIAGSNCTFVGSQSYGAAGLQWQTAIGSGSGCSGTLGCAVGGGARAGQNTVCVNGYADVTNSTVVGTLSLASGNSTQIFGYNNKSGTSINNIIVGQNCGHNGLLPAAVSNVIIGDGVIPGVLTTGQRNVFVGSVINAVAASVTNSVAIGGSINVAQNSLAMGNTVVVDATDAMAFGRNNTVQLAATDGIILGRGNTLSQQLGLIIGTANVNTSINGGCIGWNLQNTLNNSILMGFDANSQIRSTGFFKSQQSLSCAAGQLLVDGATIYGAGPTIMDIKSTRFNIGMTIDLVNDKIDLGSYPYDSGSTFDVSATFVGDSAVAGTVYQFQIFWEAPGVTPIGGLAVAYAVTESTPSNPFTNMTISTMVNVPAASTGVNKVWCEIRRLAGAGTCTISVYRLAVARRA